VGKPKKKGPGSAISQNMSKKKKKRGKERSLAEKGAKKKGEGKPKRNVSLERNNLIEGNLWTERGKSKKGGRSSWGRGKGREVRKGRSALRSAPT